MGEQEKMILYQYAHAHVWPVRVIHPVREIEKTKWFECPNERCLIENN